MKKNSSKPAHAGTREESEEDAATAARAAWLYHAGGLTQADVARALGVTSIKAHRLLAKARREGIVRVLIEGAIGGCIGLEQTLRDRFGLAECRVVPTLEPSGLPLRSLGQAGASFIRGALEGVENTVVGVGHGRSLAACMQYLPRVHSPGLRLVSLLGGLPRLRTANPYETIQAFAERTGAEAWLMPVPFFANSAAERAVLVSQRGVAETFALAREAQLCFVGIGEVSDSAFLRLSEAIDVDDLAALREAGAVGEVLGRFFDATGQVVSAGLHQLVVSSPLQDLPGLIAIAGGPGKEAAIGAVLRSGLLAGLITDETTAQKLAADATNIREGENACTKRAWTRRSTSSQAVSDAET